MKDTPIITAAKMLAGEAHKGQTRKYSGLPYIIHPIEVATIVEEAGGTDDMIAAALLHDVIEDTDFTYEDIAEKVSPEVADLVQGMTEASKPEDGNRKARKEIKLLEKDENINFSKLQERLKIFNIKNSLLYGINLLFVSNIPTITTIAIILMARYLNTMDGLVTFILHNQSLYDNVKAIIHFKNEFIKCKEPYKRITDMLDSKYITGGYYIPNKNFNGNIEFKNLKFKYEKSDTYILDNFNFTIDSGEKIAIIGESGSGKSTLVKTLTGILSPEDGEILIDDVDINTYDNKWIKSKIGYVAQDSIMFSDTIANNIAYGLDDFTQEDIEYAAKQANAHDFIMKLPDKYNTKIDGTELSSLSGGQKQRISIARALIRKPKILIFDEATSAIEPKCEEIVQ